MAHILIEGLDKTGKSTLARFLSEKTGMPIKKFSNPGPAEDPAVEYIEFIVTAEPSIIDRMHLSEMAYGPVLRDGSTIDTNVQRVIEGLLAKRGSSVGVYCYADIAELRERFKIDREDFIETSMIPAIKEGFDRALGTSRMSWVLYKVGDDMEKVYDQVR